MWCVQDTYSFSPFLSSTFFPFFFCLLHFSGSFFPWGSWHNCQWLLVLAIFKFNLEESRSLLRNLRKKTKPSEPISSYICSILSICNEEPYSLLTPCFSIYTFFSSRNALLLAYKYPSPTLAFTLTPCISAMYFLLLWISIVFSQTCLTALNTFFLCQDWVHVLLFPKILNSLREKSVIVQSL